MNYKRLILIIIICMTCVNMGYAKDKKPKAVKEKVQVEETTNRYTDYSQLFLGKDKYENFNRKIFRFNGGVNKFIIRPIDVVWTSVMPKYGIDRLKGIYDNIQYPRKLVSTLIETNLKDTKTETLRFLTNTTLGLGGMFDPAKRYFKLEPTGADLERAFYTRKIKPGSYLVVPILPGATVRDYLAQALAYPMDPSIYFFSPIAALAKAGLTLNNTAHWQPTARMVESQYADPYYIMKTFYGFQRYIQNTKLDKLDILSTAAELNTNEAQQEQEAPSDENSTNYLLSVKPSDSQITADIDFPEYIKQTPVTDSMKTALFNTNGVKDSIWSDISIWNRSFTNQIKQGKLEFFPKREKYVYTYILQKDKNAPLAIVYPSFGESADSHHCIIFAKILYDSGYSVVCQSNQFYWGLVKSMPEDYAPGLIHKDAKLMYTAGARIIEQLEKKYNRKFSDKILIGTSLGALYSLFVASRDADEKVIGFSKVIAISPPIDMPYAIKQIDGFADDTEKGRENLKSTTAVTAAKIWKLIAARDAENKAKGKDKDTTTSITGIPLPFSEDEAKLITSVLMRQKLSDLMFEIEKVPPARKTDFYERMNNMTFSDYVEQYPLKKNENELKPALDEINIFAISKYLASGQNYKIYHAIDDIYANQEQLKELKALTGDRSTYFGQGAHLGFLYRPEFIEMLRNDIKLEENLSSK